MFRNELRNADRLAAITNEVGLALWQLQSLEVAAAQFYVMVALAQLGMGLDAGMVLLRDAQAKTFGATVNKLVRENHLPATLAERFRALLSERNWLVHNSHETSRPAVFSDTACERLVARVEAIGDEARALMKELGTLGIAFARKHGVTSDRISELAAKTLAEWRKGD